LQAKKPFFNNKPNIAKYSPPGGELRGGRELFTEVVDNQRLMARCAL